MKTYNDIYIEARRSLRAAGIEASALEARLLLAAAAGKSVADFLRDIRLYPGDDYESRANAYVQRRAAGEPAAYIAGVWEFHGLELEINPNVLIPRADTEVLADAAIDHIRQLEHPRVLDLCTGSGCVGLCIADALPGARVLLTDVDKRALSLAKRNAQRLGLQGRCLCAEADLTVPPLRQLRDFDLAVCNPPYIPTRELDGLDVSVRDYEPWTALDGGDDGLDFYRLLFARWTEVLKPGGYLALECGEGQSPDLLRMGAEAGLINPETFLDSQGTERAVLFQKPS